MEYLAIGLALAVNIIFVKFKLERERYADAVLDGTILVALGMLFSGTYSGLVTATYASAFISMYLWFSPPKLFEET